MKLVALVSSGIDSPVATYLLSRYAEEMILLHANNQPFTDDREIKKFITLATFLKTILPCKVEAYLVPHGKALETYKQHSDPKFTCIFCKRMMVRYAEALAHKEHAEAIVMGDSLGQVASQTLQNLRVVDEAVHIPILRPLIGYDKNDTIEIAKKIGTYDLSIAPADGCDAVPMKPSTRAQIATIAHEERHLHVENLVQDAVSHAVVVNLSKKP